MNKRLMSISLLLGVVFMSAFIVISGCSKQNPTAPTAELPQSADRLIPATLDILEVEELISPAISDTIQIIRNTSVDNFIIPAGALNSTTAIEVRSYYDRIGTHQVLVYEFGPEGLVFNSATHLNIDITKLSKTSRAATLYYFDPLVNDWVVQGSALINLGRVDFSIYHFSKYAIE